MPLLSQPEPGFVELLASRALARFERHGRGDPIRFMVATGLANYWTYIERAAEKLGDDGNGGSFPWWRVNPYCIMLANEALAQHLQHGVPLRVAVKNLKRLKRRNSGFI